jgi:hypothetical protein
MYSVYGVCSMCGAPAEGLAPEVLGRHAQLPDEIHDVAREGTHDDGDHQRHDRRPAVRAHAEQSSEASREQGGPATPPDQARRQCRRSKM